MRTRGSPSSARTIWTMDASRSAASDSTAATRRSRRRSRSSRASASRSTSAGGSSSLTAIRAVLPTAPPLRLRSASSASLNRLGRVLSASRVIFGGEGSRASSRASPPSSVLRDVDGGDRRSIAARRSASSRNLPSAATTTTRLRLRREEAPRRYERGSGVRQRAWCARRRHWDSDAVVIVEAAARIEHDVSARARFGVILFIDLDSSARNLKTFIPARARGPTLDARAPTTPRSRARAARRRTRRSTRRQPRTRARSRGAGGENTPEGRNEDVGHPDHVLRFRLRVRQRHLNVQAQGGDLEQPQDTRRPGAPSDPRGTRPPHAAASPRPDGRPDDRKIRSSSLHSRTPRSPDADC